jgi:hypothetical protein
MSLAHSPKVVTDGLVFYIDMGNPDKSWKGAPTTNLITNPLPNGTTTGFAALGGVGTLTYDTQNQAIKWVRTSYESWGAYHTVTPIFNGTLSTSVQYTISFEWKVENNNFSNSVYTYELVQGNAVSPAGTANLAANSTLQPNGWFLFKYTFTPANAGVGDAYNRIYFPSQSANTSTFYWRKIQFEQRAFATPFVSGTRSNTQVLIDLTNLNTITATSMTYSSNGSFNFDGSTSYFSMPYTQTSPNNFTVEAWINSTEHSGDANIGKIIVMPYSNYNAWIFSLNGTTSLLQLRHHNFSNSSTSYNIVSSTGLSLNTWYHIVATDDGTTVRLYVNGAQVASGSSAVSTTNSPMTLQIGAWPGASSSVFFKGQIPSVKIYTRALGSGEVSQNFNALRGRYGI